MELKYENLHIKTMYGRSKPKWGSSKQHDTPTTGQNRVKNLTKKQLTKEQINILNLGPNTQWKLVPKNAKKYHHRYRKRH